jgi:hypothetical protein
MSDFEDSNKPQTSDDQEPVQGKVFEEFCSDLESIESLGVTLRSSRHCRAHLCSEF